MSFASHFTLDMREKSRYFWLRYSHVSLYNMSCQLPACYNIRRRIQSADLSAIGNVSRDESRGRRKGEKTGKTVQCCRFPGQKSSLILVFLLICSCSARWTGRMINGCEITKDVMARKFLFILWRKTVRRMLRSLAGNCWIKRKEKGKKFDTWSQSFVREWTVVLF